MLNSCMLASYLHPNFDTESEAHFQAHFTPAMLHKGTAAAFKMSPFMRSRQVLTAVNLSDAVRGCDTYAETKVVFGRMALGSGFHFFGLECFIIEDDCLRPADFSVLPSGGKRRRQKARKILWPSDGA